MPKSFRWILALAALITNASAHAASAPLNHVVISEVQTGTTVSASQEFVELYNPASVDQALGGWTLEYKSATGSDTAWSKKATLAGVIQAHGFYLVAPKTYLPAADADWAATLAAAGGHLRLKDGNGTVVDLVGYGDTANAAEGAAPALAPGVGQSLERLPGRLDELAGNGTDTDNNAADFILRPTPQPQSTASAIEDPAVADTVVSLPDPLVEPVADPPPEAPVFASIEISELLPNPLAPLTDAHDEFIELYNPNAQPVDLAGYTLKAGSNFHGYYVLPTLSITPGGYLALYAYQTKLSLPNSGGAVELLDPAGTVTDVTEAYGSAPDGQSWTRDGDRWAWSLQPTPGSQNVVVAPVSAAAPATKPISTKKPSAAKPKVAAPKAAKATTKKASAKKVTKKPAATKPALPSPRDFTPATWLLIGLGALTMGYACYEFRYDLHNLYCRLRGNPIPRRPSGAAPEGRGGD